MTKECPAEIELIRLTDGDLPPEVHDRIRAHVASCKACAEQVRELENIKRGLTAEPVQDLDVERHLNDVNARIAASKPRRRLTKTAWLLALGTLAAGLAIAYQVTVERDNRVGEFAARGGLHQASLSRDVNVQIYTAGPTPDALRPGQALAKDSPLTVGFGNLGKEAAYLLVFGVDSQSKVHWIAPEYSDANSDPAAVSIEGGSQRLLGTSVVFDDLAPGPMRIVSLIAARPMRVSDVEKLSPSELRAGALAQHFDFAEVRELVVNVTATGPRN
ncbi:MAG TPA: zf-HC2 domain-containing protein [Polyangiaceae bacterium]|jgi:hypothetical protein|nr:zf-HC2 domain-containing protein [Polyangiaceae bacterium]